MTTTSYILSAFIRFNEIQNNNEKRRIQPSTKSLKGCIKAITSPTQTSNNIICHKRVAFTRFCTCVRNARKYKIYWPDYRKERPVVSRLVQKLARGLKNNCSRTKKKRCSRTKKIVRALKKLFANWKKLLAN